MVTSLPTLQTLHTLRETVHRIVHDTDLNKGNPNLHFAFNVNEPEELHNSPENGTPENGSSSSSQDFYDSSDSGEFSSDDEDQSPVNNDEFENVSDKADSVSNLSEGVNDGLNKLREDYLALLSEVKELRDTYKDGIMLVNANLAKQHDYFVEAIQEGNMRIRQIDDRVDDKLDKFHYSSDERIKEIEERLDDYKYKMTKFEELQEQKRMEHPLTGNDIATRGRDVMSSVISLGLASVSLLLFLFTTAVDCLKVFSENNALSTGLSLGLFGVIIATYYYFDTERTSL